MSEREKSEESGEFGENGDFGENDEIGETRARLQDLRELAKEKGPTKAANLGKKWRIWGKWQILQNFAKA